MSLAKEVTRLNDDGEQYDKFATRGGVMDGETLTPERVKEISKWPSRTEQLSMLVGQILGPGAQLAAAIKGPGATLASQIKQKSEGEALLRRSCRLLLCFQLNAINHTPTHSL